MLDRADRPPSRRARRRARPRAWLRRYRARQRDGLMVPSMPGIGADEISFLIETQWSDERDSRDRRAIGCAVARAVTRN